MGKVFKIVIQIILVIALISSVTFGYFQYAQNKVLIEKLDKTRTGLIEVKLTLESPNMALTEILKGIGWLSNKPNISRSDIAPVKAQVDSAYKLIVEIKNNLD